MTEPRTQFSFPEVRVVEASAGSGKTFCLARRYIQLLLNPSSARHGMSIRSILAITFTNKAAFEMKSRIIETLKKMALQSLSDWEARDLIEPLGLTPEQAGRRAFLLMEELIHQYNFFQVQTIDSFINALLSGCAFKIGLSANFRIRTDYADYLQYSLDTLIEQSGHNPEVSRCLAEFLHQYLFLENKNGWFPKDDMLSLLTALYEQSHIYGCDFVPFGADSQDLIVKKSRILSLMRDLQARLPDGTHKRFRDGLKAFLERYQHGFDIDKLSDYFARGDLPVTRGCEADCETERLWHQIHSELRQLCETEACSLFNPYIAVYHQVIREFAALAAREDLLFLPELNAKARQLFDEDLVTVEELYYRLATRFHHYLIDEFQDTSRLQWDNLFCMVEEALSTGGSLFYVGDKKQAIYGFRGGDAHLFDGVARQFRHFHVRPETLSRNYRSRAAIVHFNNRIFDLDNLVRFLSWVEKKRKDDIAVGEEDLKELASVFHASRQEVREDKPGGVVRITYLDGARKEDREEAARGRLSELLKNLLKRYAPRQIAVLTRNNREVEAVTAWLLEDRIPVESERTLNIREQPLVQELVHFLAFLDSPVDDQAFARFILGDIFAGACGLEPSDLHAFVLQARRDEAMRQTYLYKAFRRAFPGVWDRLLEPFFRNVGLTPLYELMISILGCYQVLDRFPERQGYVMGFLELIKRNEEEFTDLGSFFQRLEGLQSEDLYVRGADSDAVRVLTVHKSKGLEFPVVVIPFLGMDIHVGAGGGMGQQSYILEQREQVFELMRIKSKYLKFSPKLAGIWQREYLRALYSELNSVYVALTRAEKELYAFIPERVGARFNFVRFLIPEDALEAGEQPGAPEDEAFRSRPSSTRLLAPSQYRDWIQFLKEEFPPDETGPDRRAILRGQAVHAVLAGIGSTSGQKPSDLIDRAVGQAAAVFPAPQDWTGIRAVVEEVLQTPAYRRFFDAGDAEVRQEIELIDARGRTGRIDRLILKDDEAWVVDYKSSREGSEDHRRQVGHYMKTLQEIFPGRRVRGFLLYLDQHETEEVSCAD